MAEKAKTQACKEAEREATARANVQRAYKLAVTRMEKDAEKSCRATTMRSTCTSRASHTMEGCQEVGVGIQIGEVGAEIMSFHCQNFHATLSQFAAFGHQVHAPPFPWASS